MVYYPETKGEGDRSSTRRLDHDGTEEIDDGGPQRSSGMGGETGFQLDRRGCVSLSFTVSLYDSEAFQVSETTRKNLRDLRRANQIQQKETLGSNKYKEGNPYGGLIIAHPEFRRGSTEANAERLAKHVEWLVYLGWETATPEKVERMRVILNNKVEVEDE